MSWKQHVELQEREIRQLGEEPFASETPPETWGQWRNRAQRLSGQLVAIEEDAKFLGQCGKRKYE